MLEEHIVLNGNSRIPIYLQIKEQIKEYIENGNVGDEEQLPPVTAFAEKLGINFETVRKAYKELEREGFLDMKRGLGTFFNTKAVHSAKNLPPVRTGDFLSDAKELIKYYVKKDLFLNDIKKQFDQALSEISEEFGGQKVVFTESSSFYTKDISGIITQALTSMTEPRAKQFYINVEGVLLNDLKSYLDQTEGINKLTVVTTGFHYDEVKEIIGQRPIHIHVLITNMSKEARQKLLTFGEDTKFGLISAVHHTASIFIDILKEELGDVNVKVCPIKDDECIKKLLAESDVILVPPAVYETVQELAPPNVPLILVSDRVDPMSLKLLKDYLISTN